MKILLLNPPSPKDADYVRVERCTQKKSVWGGSLWQPLSLLYAQAILDKNDYKTKLKDATAEEISFENVIDFVIKENPDFLVVNTAIPTILNDCKLALKIKKAINNLKTIAIGLPTNLLPLIIAEYKFDYAILGDVEYAIIDILKGKKEFIVKKIRNTYFVKHFVDNLNELPFPALHDLEVNKYRLPFTHERLMLVNLARGCPFKCIFCIVPTIDSGKVRFRSAKNFVDELERDYYEYKIKNFLFWAENGTLNRKFMTSLCNEILKRGLKIKWMTPSRVDTVDQEILNKMKEAGCWLLSYGIESIDQKVLDKAKKGITTEQIEKAIIFAHKAGIKVIGHIIIGLPGQTRESVEKTIDWVMQKNIDYCQFYCAVPLWGTELRNIAKKKRWIKSNNKSNYELNKAVMRNDFLSIKEIEELRRLAYLKFYLRPKVVLRELLIYKFNLIYFANFIRDGIYFLKDYILD
jgi:radical SAM superfamily enzyme YgiQ (UPF0313 family)